MGWRICFANHTLYRLFAMKRHFKAILYRYKAISSRRKQFWAVSYDLNKIFYLYPFLGGLSPLLHILIPILQSGGGGFLASTVR